MKKILYILKSYPPRQSANALCDSKVIDCLKKEDVSIDCLASRFYNDNVTDNYDGLKVYRVSRSFFWRIYTYSRENKTCISKCVFRINRLINRVKQIITIPIYPIFEPLMCIKLAREALKLDRENRYDIVIAEHNGLDSLYAGWCAKKHRKDVCYIPVLWDPIFGKTEAKYLPLSFAQKRTRNLERKVLSSADRIISMKSIKPFHEANIYSESYYSRIHYLDIPGIHRCEKVSIRDNYTVPGKINMVFSGALTLPDRDPTPLIETLMRYKDVSEINLMFFVTGNGVKVLEQYKKVFKGNMIIHGYISQDEIHAVYSNCDYLINIGGPNPTMVPSKIFEYMSFCKPIISFYKIHNDTSNQYLCRYPLAIMINENNDYDTNADLLYRKINEIKNKSVAYEDVEKEFKGNTPEAYKNVILGLSE